jgi:DNA-binding beta-propeller fold protein YncE
VGDFSDVFSKGYPSRLYYLNGDLYSFDPANNVIAKMTADGQVEVANQGTRDVGYFEGGVAHEADKSLILMTDTPGIVVFDTLTGLLQKQGITFPSGEPELKGVSIYGNRLYLYDRSAQNIYGYSKTLRGYSGGSPWITNNEFSVENINDIGVDGYIYTLHANGEISKLLKGEPVDFSLAQVEPRISTAARLYINENINHIYVFDPPAKRVIIFDTVGNLNRQIYLGDELSPVDIAVDPEEESIYVLDGKRVVKVPLAENSN